MIRDEKVHIRRVSYAIFHFFLRLAFKVLFTMKITGEEYVPRGEPLIVLANHTSFMDPVVMGVAAPQELNYMAKKELFKNILFRWLIVGFRAFPLHRGVADRRAIARALEVLSKREPLFLFPEGTRGDGTNIQPTKAGVGMLIYKSKARVVPALIKGANKVLPPNAKFIYLRHLEVWFGKPLKLEDYFQMQGQRETYELIAREVTESFMKLKSKIKI